MEEIVMRLPRPILALVLGAVLAAPVSLATGSTATATTTPTLVAVRAAHNGTNDRVVFEFTGGLPTRRTVGYVSQLTADPSGLPVPIAGRAILAVTLFPTNAHTEAGVSTAPASATYPLPNVMTVKRSGDFEAVTSYGIGLAGKQPFRVFTLTHPYRLVIDIKAAFPTVQKRVYFFNQPRFVANTPPFFTSVLRPVLPGTPATGLMDRIFAGPTSAEYRAGLRSVTSQATGFTRLSVVSTVARVQLTGGCTSNGSTVTIAGEIMPTLRQLSTVDHVKIYDTTGHTERPYGHSDSIPFCLEP
jgi:Sporulation and spore germination